MYQYLNLTFSILYFYCLFSFHCLLTALSPFPLSWHWFCSLATFTNALIASDIIILTSIYVDIEMYVCISIGHILYVPISLLLLLCSCLSTSLSYSAYKSPPIFNNNNYLSICQLFTYSELWISFALPQLTFLTLYQVFFNTSFYFCLNSIVLFHSFHSLPPYSFLSLSFRLPPPRRIFSLDPSLVIHFIHPCVYPPLLYIYASIYLYQRSMLTYTHTHT